MTSSEELKAIADAIAADYGLPRLNMTALHAVQLLLKERKKLCAMLEEYQDEAINGKIPEK
jgi:hypothetical protein